MDHLRAWVKRIWTPTTRKHLRWIALLLVQVYASWQWWGDLDRPIAGAVSLGMAFALTLLGAPPLVGALAAAMSSIRYMVFLLPLFKVIGNTGWSWPAAGWIAAALWDALPTIVAVYVSLHLIKRKAPGWIVLLSGMGFYAGLSVWVPRPYEMSLGGLFVNEAPAWVWLLGSDLLGGLLIGMIGFAFASALNDSKAKPILVTGGLIGMVLLGAFPAFAKWKSNQYQAERFTHEVILGQPNIRPFLGNFQMMSQYMIGPAVLLSSLGADLIVMPEGLMQTSQQIDPRDEDGAQKRYMTAVATGVISPYSQFVFGVRDFHSARIYFTDFINNERTTSYKDLEKRIPVVDWMPSFLAKRINWTSDLNIQKAEKTPLLQVWSSDVPGGQKTYKADAVIAMSGEIRSTRRMLEKLRGNPTIVAVVNPTISGWMGDSESKGSAFQARAKALELGLVDYRAGQNTGTEVYIPWGPHAVKDQYVHNLGGGTIKFTAYVPYKRPWTPYTSFGWLLSFFLFPVLGATLFGIWMMKPLRRAVFGVANG